MKSSKMKWSKLKIYRHGAILFLSQISDKHIQNKDLKGNYRI